MENLDLLLVVDSIESPDSNFPLKNMYEKFGPTFGCYSIESPDSNFPLKNMYEKIWTYFWLLTP